VNGQAEVALHWGGGRHHAHSDRAAGFCFVNDVVLAIQHLQRHFSLILYIDIDINHSDGVQDSFYDTDQVMTVSFHRHSRGSFPGRVPLAKRLCTVLPVLGAISIFLYHQHVMTVTLSPFISTLWERYYMHTGQNAWVPTD
jgi:hypothetical protein